MAGYKKKKGYKRSTRKSAGAKPRRRKPKKALTKRESSQVKKMIDKALDNRIEDKFRLDSSFNTVLGAWSNLDRGVVADVTPTISVGTGAHERIGDKIYLKGAKLQFRYLPCERNVVLDVDQISNSIVMSQSPVPQFPPMRVYLYSIVEKVHSQLSATELRAALDAKYTPPGLWRQDMAQDTAQDTVKAIRTLKKFTMPTKYNILTTSVVGDPAVGTPDRIQVIASPKMETFSCYLPIKKKLEISNVDNMPTMQRFGIYYTDYSHWTATSVMVQDEPNMLDIRKCWIYEDA